MSCSCQNNKEEINNGKQIFLKLRELFIKRMTEDSKHNDRRRRDFNQAIFGWQDENDKTPEKTYCVWSDIDMDMVLRCFDDAVNDWRRSWCDVENCRRK